MQMRAHHVRDGFRLDAEPRKAGQEVALALVELFASRPRLVTAGVDQDGVAAGLHHEGMEAHDDVTVGRHASGQQPLRLGDHLGGRGGKELTRRKGREFQLRHAADGECSK
jgi:hypothetical protein